MVESTNDGLLSIDLRVLDARLEFQGKSRYNSAIQQKHEEV